MKDLKEELRDFANERDWDQFHTPKNLVMALSGEIGELSDIFQWLSPSESELRSLSTNQLKDIKEEIADIYLYLTRLSDKLGIDLDEVAREKLKVNSKKYPVELSKGNSTKYNKR